MKVVLFCGGYGMRMRDGVRDVPKPMAMVGDHPLLWHVMRYYAHHGHNQFILCLGYGAHHITQYFLDYEDAHTNDFVLRGGTIERVEADVSTWEISFVHTGRDTPIGERLRRVRHLLRDEEMFMANYADVLTDAPLHDIVDRFTESGADASLLAVPPQSAFHVVATDEGEPLVRDIYPVSELPLRENGGYFVFRQAVLDALTPDCDLVGDTLTAMARSGRLTSYPYDGFWVPADTVKERSALDELASSGRAPWAVWRDNRAGFLEPQEAPTTPPSESPREDQGADPVALRPEDDR